MPSPALVGHVKAPLLLRAQEHSLELGSTWKIRPKLLSALALSASLDLGTPGSANTCPILAAYITKVRELQGVARTGGSVWLDRSYLATNRLEGVFNVNHIYLPQRLRNLQSTVTHAIST